MKSAMGWKFNTRILIPALLPSGHMTLTIITHCENIAICRNREKIEARMSMVPVIGQN